VTPPRVTIVETGVANTASVVAALTRLGCACDITRDADRIAAAALLVLPGVGCFAAGMESLERAGLADVLQERVARDRPTLAVCLGLQLLCERSEESPGVAGLGIIRTRVGRFAPEARTPQFGWNTVEPTEACGLVEPGYAYFANSFRLTEAPTGWVASWADHAGPFVAALERGQTLACQFHPELSGPWGAALLRRWLVQSGYPIEQGTTPC
jgi:glutamine amidotransferase